MMIAHAYTLLLEAAVMAASFGILWLSFWVRDGRRQQNRATHHPASDFTIVQRDSANVGALVLPTVASAIGLAIDVGPSDVQPASEKDKAFLYRPEHAQHFKPMNSDPVKIHDPALLGEGAALAQKLSD
jgi:hypothetical protein